MCPWHEKSGDIAMIWAQKPLNRAYRPAADGYLADGTAQRHRPGSIRPKKIAIRLRQGRLRRFYGSDS